jgi:hypothetical protein
LFLHDAKVNKKPPAFGRGFLNMCIFYKNKLFLLIECLN